MKGVRLPLPKKAPKVIKPKKGRGSKKPSKADILKEVGKKDFMWLWHNGMIK